MLAELFLTLFQLFEGQLFVKAYKGIVVISPDIEQIKRTLGVLFQPGDTVELRCIADRVVNGYYRNPDKLAVDACSLNGDITPQHNIYTCLNPVDPQLYGRRADQYAYACKGEGVKDQDIICRRWLLLDIDPVRPSGVSATSGQRAAALQVAKAVYRYLQQLNLPAPVVADSGNGQHLLLRLADLPNTAEVRWASEQFLRHLHDRHSNELAHVDQTTFNAARISCLYGTIKRKGTDLPEQPHRLSKLLAVPDPLQAVSLEQLLAVVGPYPGDPQQQPQAATGPAWNIPQLLAQRNVEYEQDTCQTSSGEQTARYQLDSCPFNPEHNDGSAVILQWSNGATSFRCHHNSCTGKDWQALKELWQLNGSPGVTAADIVLPAQQQQVTAGQELIIVRSLDVQPVPIEWLWQDRLVIGGINLLCGRGGIGKTYQTCDLVGRITNTALPAPDGQPIQHGRVLYSSAEDHLAKVVEPRMQLHGVDRSRLEYITGSPAGTHVQLLDVITHCHLLDTALQQRPDCIALVLDPISAFQGDTDSNKVAAVRRFTGVLSQLAERHNIAIIGIHHFNKGRRDFAGDSISGSHAYRDAARAVWLFALDENDHTRRLMVCDKYNWASACPPGLAYRIENGVICYEAEPLDMTSAELLAQGTEKPVDVAAAWLLAQLSQGELPASDLQIAATLHGIKDRTLNRAKKQLGVVSRKVENRWYWALQDASNEQEGQVSGHS